MQLIILILQFMVRLSQRFFFLRHVWYQPYLNHQLLFYIERSKCIMKVQQAVQQHTELYYGIKREAYFEK